MRCVAGARRRRINQRVGGSDARRCVSAGENVEFFSKGAPPPPRGQCVSASARLLAAPRRRGECLSAMTALQTRAARRAGQSQLGPALCLRAQATGGPRSSFSEALITTKAATSRCTYHCCDIPRKHSGAANFGGCLRTAGHSVGPARKQPRRLRIDPETYVRAETASDGLCNPHDLPNVLLAPTKRRPSTRRRRAAGRSDRATSRQHRAVASRGSRTRGQPLANKIEPGQP